MAIRLGKGLARKAAAAIETMRVGDHATRIVYADSQYLISTNGAECGTFQGALEHKGERYNVYLLGRSSPP